MYFLYTCSDFDELRTLRGGGPNSAPVAGTVMGADFPIDESYEVFVWDATSTASHNPPEVLHPIDPETQLNSTAAGRWCRVDLGTIPQVNSDWNASSGLAQILNKPTLATVATSGAYNDLTGKPTLASVATSGSYDDLSNKPTIPNAFALGQPVSRSLSLATAYQASDNTKGAVVTVNWQASSNITLAGNSPNEGEIRIGSTTAVATGTGTVASIYKNNISGTVVVGVAVTFLQGQTATFFLPAGWYFAVRQTTGSGLSIVSAFDQTLS